MKSITKYSMWRKKEREMQGLMSVQMTRKESLKCCTVNLSHFISNIIRSMFESVTRGSAGLNPPGVLQDNMTKNPTIHAKRTLREGVDVCHCTCLLKHGAAGRSGFSLALDLCKAQMLLEE